MPWILNIPQNLLQSLVSETLRSKIEICGVLIGEKRGNHYIVTKALSGRNIKNSPVLFEIAPEDLYRAATMAESEGLDIVGLYHSHPAPPKPSIRDLDGMRLWPLPWLIISSIDGSYDCYMYNYDENRVVRVKIVIENGD